MKTRVKSKWPAKLEANNTLKKFYLFWKKVKAMSIPTRLIKLKWFLLLFYITI